MSRRYNRLVGQVCECLWLSRPACRRCPRSVGNKASFPPRSPQRLVLQGQETSVVRRAGEPSQVPAAAARGPVPARPAWPLSFCDLPLEGTSCSAQLGNKGHHQLLTSALERGLPSPHRAPAAAPGLSPKRGGHSCQTRSR